MRTMIEAASHLHAIPVSATPEEAAAIVAAIERFVRDTAAPAPAPGPGDDWGMAARLEGVSRDPLECVHHPWVEHLRSLSSINT